MIDVAVIGAGISGIGAASYLTMKCPNKSFQIIESRKNIGGTWDLFKYPGIRSDSDVYDGLLLQTMEGRQNPC
jgi:cation diffusion facilitator CzcD-associated flavoprotein CzcO